MVLVNVNGHEITVERALRQALLRDDSGTLVDTLIDAELVRQHIRGRDLGFAGEPRVNVVELNLALDSGTPG